MKFNVGDVFEYKRTFTKDEVDDFIKLAKYTGKHHIIPNEDNEVMIQGLLTATLPTTIGGEHDILMYKMIYNLLKPVYTSDEIICKVKVDELFEKNGQNRINFTFSCINQKTEEVLNGVLKGILLDL